jgi:aspartate/methionine/tyrosine aminotransferase
MMGPLLADRMSHIPFSDIRRVFDKAACLEAEGARVVHFEIGRPDFDTPEHIKAAAVDALGKGMVHYTPNPGIPALRKAFAESIRTHKGVDYDPDTELMVTAGGQEAMCLTLQACLNPGDEVLVPDPGYTQFSSSVLLVGAVPVPLPLREDQYFTPDLAAAEKLITGRTRAIIVNSPQNPTGAVIGVEQVTAICRFADAHGLMVFSDEAYDRIVYGDSTFVSPAAVAGMKEKTAIWGSLSKTYSMTGWRIGYLAGPAGVIRAAIKIQQNVMLSVNSFAQAGAVAAVKGPQACVDRMVEKFDARRRVILEGIQAAPGLSCPVIPKGAFFVFARVDVPGMTSNALADYLLVKGHVALVPGEPFGSKGKGFLRISYATSLAQCKEGMDRMVATMKKLDA